MKRQSVWLVGALNPIAKFASRYFGAKKPRASAPIDHRKQAEELDQLATTIQTPADARRFVHFLADMFANETPSAWTSRSVLDRIAQAEFSAVSDPQEAIPEPRLAEAWNAYVDTIGAPEDQKVAPKEIHNLRDAFLTAGQIARNRGSRNFWTIPSIYATLADGRLAPGCRAVESIRVLWDLANKPENIQAARDRSRKGVLMSDLYRQRLQAPSSSATSVDKVSGGIRSPYPIQLAQRQYVQHNGNKAYSRAVMAMLTKTLS